MVRATYVLSVDVVGSRFDRNAVISALVYKIRQMNVVRVHCIESVGVLHPVRSKWCVDSCSIAINVVKKHISTSHNVQRPQRRVFDVDC